MSVAMIVVALHDRSHLRGAFASFSKESVNPDMDFAHKAVCQYAPSMWYPSTCFDCAVVDDVRCLHR
jgi:hypothetical protein